MDNIPWVETARPHQENKHKGWFRRRRSVVSEKGSTVREIDGCITSTGLLSRTLLLMSRKTSEVKGEKNVSCDWFLSFYFFYFHTIRLTLLMNGCKSRALLEQLVRWSSSWTILSVLCSVYSNSENRERCHHDYPKSPKWHLHNARFVLLRNDQK